MRNSLEKHLVKLVGHGKQFDATPTRVTVKCNPDKPTPSHLIDNIDEYMSSFNKLCRAKSSGFALLFSTRSWTHQRDLIHLIF